MSTIRIAHALLAAVLAGASGPAAAASLTVFEHDLAGWQAAVGGVFVTEDFEDATLAPGLAILGDGTITGGVYDDNVDDSPLDTATWLFTPDVIGAGGFFDLDPATAGTGIELEVLFAGGGSQSVFIESAANLDGFTGFFGVVADTKIDRIVLSGGIDPFGISEVYTLDDLVFAVPEPSGLALALLGLAGGVHRGVRRGRRPLHG